MGDPAPGRLRLTQAMRLRQPGDFARIRKRGGRLSRGCLIGNWLSLPAGSLSRVGVVTSKKLGKAHIRSRARRLLRESFRLHQHELRDPVALVLVARSSIVGRTQAEVERDLLSLLSQGGLLKKVE